MATGIATRGVDLTYEELIPSSVWTEDSILHCLLIDLPGFKKEQVKVQVDNNGYVIASGERIVSENKRIRFQQSYKIPENSNTEEITAKFEDEILYIIIPKKMTPTKNIETTINNDIHHQNEASTPKQDENISQNDDNNGSRKRNEEEFHDAATKWSVSGLLETAKEKVKKKKGMILTAVLAFSLGVIVSRQFHSHEE